jgi:hypothetical protein
MIMEDENVIRNNPRPTVVLGDIHGSTYWKEIVNGDPGCRYIFLGDYLDPYEYIPSKQLIENLKEIIQLKKDRNDDVILLLGNHDLHYFRPEIGISTRFDSRIADEVEALFVENLPLFAYAFQDGKRLFTHAGISEKWFRKDFRGDADQNIADRLNNPRPDQLDALYRVGAMRGGFWGDIGGIFWADIDELRDPLPGYEQFVGHNRVGKILEYSNNGGKITFCDCLYNRKYLKLDG